MIVKLLVLGAVIITGAAVVDCLKRRSDLGWLFIVLVFWFWVGPLIYFAYTRDWLGKWAALAAGQAGGSGRGAAFGPRRSATIAGDELLERGLRAAKRGRDRQAIKLLEQLVADEGLASPLEARYHLGLAYKRAGRNAEAVVQLSLLAREAPEHDDGQALLELADAYVLNEETDKALLAYARLCELSRLPQGRYNYAILLAQHGQQDEAATQLERLLEDAEDNPRRYQGADKKFIRLAQDFLRKQASA
ncbi:tetratricopeptide repeat protein [Candidatus Sumerlaeota bacterium]